MRWGMSSDDDLYLVKFLGFNKTMARSLGIVVRYYGFVKFLLLLSNWLQTFSLVDLWPHYQHMCQPYGYFNPNKSTRPQNSHPKWGWLLQWTLHNMQ